MTPRECRSALQSRLVIDQAGDGALCCLSGCSQPLDPLCWHANSCVGRLFARHQIVCTALRRLYDTAGFHPKMDGGTVVPGVRRGRATSNHPADLLVAGDTHTFDCIDVSIVSAVSPNADNFLPEVGEAARKAEAAKLDKHGPGCASSNLGFSPFVADIFGVLAPKAHGILRRISSRLVSELGYSSHRATQVCYRRISTAIQIAVARQVLSSKAVVDLPDAGLPE